jgi:hypothetical protein
MGRWGTFNFCRHFGTSADITVFSLLPGVSVTPNQSAYNFLFGATATTNFGRTSVFGRLLAAACSCATTAGYL